MVLRRVAPNYMGFMLCLIFSISFSIGGVSYASAQDTSAVQNPDSLPYPIHDRRGDFLSSNPNTFDLQNPPNIDDSVAYYLSLIHISEPTRQAEISYAVF